MTGPQSAANPRARVGWHFYDFANSPSSTTVAMVFMGPYLTSVATAAADQSAFVYPFGMPIHAVRSFRHVVSLSLLIQAVGCRCSHAQASGALA